MDSSKLRPEQRDRLMRWAHRRLLWLNKLVARMQRLGFPDSDPLWREGLRARDAMQRLFDASRITPPDPADAASTFATPGDDAPLQSRE